MTVSYSTLAHVAALAAAVPGCVATLETVSGRRIIVGDHPEASLCTHTFRHVIADWPEGAEHSPCVTGVEFNWGVERGPLLEVGAVRWFVTELDEAAAAHALRVAGTRGAVADTQIRRDAMLGLTVVRMQSDDLSHDELHRAAVSAYAACIASELVQSVHGADVSPS